MKRRAATTAVMLMLGCGPEVIKHDEASDTGSTGDATSTDDDGSSTSADESSTGEPPEIPGEGPYGAGTRLVPVVERTSDGVSQLVHWYDTELGIDCELERDSAGTVRCLPIDVPGVFVGFAEEDCTSPVVGAFACASVPTHLRGAIPGAAGCSEGTRQQAYLRGAPVGSGPVGDLGIGGSCSSTSTFPERYALTPIDDEEFVAATVVVETRGSVTVRAFVAEDGAFERHGLVDPRTGTACIASVADIDGQPAIGCSMPFTSPYGFSDDTCTTTVAVYPDDGTCEPAAIKVLAGVEEWRVLGEPWAGPIYDLASDSTCEAIPAPLFDPWSYHAIGEAIPAVDSPLYARVVAEDEGRLRRIALAGDGETLVLPGIRGYDDARWFDTLLEQECGPAADDQGALRCFPRPLVRSSRLEYWGDETCSEIPLFDTVETDTPFSRITRMEYDECGNVSVESLQNVVGTWDGPVYGPSDDDACVLQEIDEWVGIYQLGNYAQLDDAPILELATDE